MMAVFIKEGWVVWGTPRDRTHPKKEYSYHHRFGNASYIETLHFHSPKIERKLHSKNRPYVYCLFIQFPCLIETLV